MRPPSDSRNEDAMEAQAPAPSGGVRPRRQGGTAMRRVILLAAATLATASPAAPAREPVQKFPDQKVVTGFYQGRTLRYPDLGFGQKRTLGFARGRTVAYLDLGAVKLRPGNKVAPIWGFTNGVEAQRNVIDVVPDQRGYTPLWRVNMVTWADGVSPRVLDAAKEIRAAAAAGELTIRRTTMVVNCPVL